MFVLPYDEPCPALPRHVGASHLLQPVDFQPEQRRCPLSDLTTQCVNHIVVEFKPGSPQIYMELHAGHDVEGVSGLQ